MNSSLTQASVVRDPAPTHHPVYRDGTLGVLHQREVLLADYRERLAEVPPELRALYARRLGRVVAGAVATATMMLVAVCTFDLDVALTPLLIAGWAVSGLGLFAGRSLGRRLFDRALVAGAAPGPDPLRDLARLAIETPERRGREMCARLERASLGAPLVGASLLIPLSIHLIAFLVVGMPGGLAGFDLWIRLSAFLVGFAHVVLATLAWALACELAQHGSPRRYGASGAIGYTTLAGCVPGIIALGVPPLLVALTALLFVPLLFAWAARAIERERRFTVLV